MSTDRSVNTSQKATEAEGSQVRQRILHAARQLFTEQGYAATALRQVATAAETTKPMVYYYFGSKEGLYQTLVESTYQQFAGMLQEVVSGGGTTRDKLLAMARLHMQGAADNLESVRFLAAASLAPRSGAPANPCPDFQDLSTRVLHGLVTEGIARGELAPVSPDLAAAVLRGCLNLFYEAALHDVPLPDTPQLPEQIIDLLFSGIAPTSP